MCPTPLMALRKSSEWITKWKREILHRKELIDMQNLQTLTPDINLTIPEKRELGKSPTAREKG
jgi:hypothetical protein